MRLAKTWTCLACAVFGLMAGCSEPTRTEATLNGKPVEILQIPAEVMANPQAKEMLTEGPGDVVRAIFVERLAAGDAESIAAHYASGWPGKVMIAIKRDRRWAEQVTDEELATAGDAFEMVRIVAEPGNPVVRIEFPDGTPEKTIQVDRPKT